MSFLTSALILVSAFVIAYFSTPLVIRLAHRLGAIDQPDKRKVHQTAMPRMGGLAIFFAFMICVLLGVKVSGPYVGIVIGAVIIFIIGILDDVYQLSAWIKLAGQIIATAVAVYFGVVIHFVSNPFDGMLALGYLSIPLTFLWIVGITNAINLIDGLDGLAAGVAGIAGMTMGIVALMQGQMETAIIAFALVAAIMGFLPYNFHPARTFMGDCGSNFLGFVLGCLAVTGVAKSTALISLVIPIVILGIPIFDTFFAIFRRIYKKTPIFMPDKDHLHHRLLKLGYSHQTTVLIIYAISGFFALTAIVLSWFDNPKATLVLAFLLLFMVIGANRIGMLTGQTKASVHSTDQSTGISS
ncbi:MAG TPA: MraY family glycosyltransferase [Syntrophomonas sp.]|nr:MraY family glycosyltransferase [Syntrophomonas sp.]HRW12060.1 MraY family glycosyltransferase [Syntrophomonas sp.]